MLVTPQPVVPSSQGITGQGSSSTRPERGGAVRVPVMGDWERPLVAVTRPMMGGSVAIHLASIRAVAEASETADRREATRVLERMAAWSERLTRFSVRSDLSRLNASPIERVPVRPTLAMLLDWGRAAEAMTDGVVDIAMLDARLSAEGLRAPWPGAASAARAASSPRSAASRRWSVERGTRWSYVRRPDGVHFDLDGVAKGWLADRALARLRGRTAIVDADGDIAVRVVGADPVHLGIADPRRPGRHLAVLALRAADDAGATTFGLATSGTSVHRWSVDGRPTHHLIDPLTGRPAVTDVVQATVLCGSAREAEVLAKTAVIEGAEAAFDRLAGPSVLAAILLTETGEVLATPATHRWLA